VRNKVIACAVAATAVCTVAAGPAIAKSRGQKVTCHSTNLVLRPATASAPGGIFGFVTCSGPFGKGVEYDTYTQSPKTSTTGTIVRKLKLYFNNGTVSGISKGTYQLTSPTTAIINQKVKWTSGTGVFKGIKAAGSGTARMNGANGMIKQTIFVSAI
jgi:hypothetical protein